VGLCLSVGPHMCSKTSSPCVCVCVCLDAVRGGDRVAAGAADRRAAAAVLPADPRRAQRDAALALRLREERRPGEDRHGAPGSVSSASEFKNTSSSSLFTS